MTRMCFNGSPLKPGNFAHCQRAERARKAVSACRRLLPAAMRSGRPLRCSLCRALLRPQMLLSSRAQLRDALLQLSHFACVGALPKQLFLRNARVCMY
eukprot:1463009-Pleurochrysis_carterae.AAC.1